MPTNNNGNSLESWAERAYVVTGSDQNHVTTYTTTGNTVNGSPQIDFVWGNMPMQPNDERANADYTTASSTVVVAANAAQNDGWSGYTVYPSSRLNPNNITASYNNVGGTTSVPNNHAVVEADYAGFPTFTPSPAVAIVTAASGNGTTVTYTSQNTFTRGQSVTITGLPVGALNLSGVTIASVDATKFTVTNSATGSVTGAYGRAEDASAPTDGAYVSGVAYIQVPNVLGLTSALAADALRDAGYEAASVTTAAGATNTLTQPTQINVTSTTAATVTVAGGTGTWPVGTYISIAAGTGIPTALVGDWLVTGGSGSTLVIAGSGWTVANTGAITPGTVLKGKTGTVKTQSTAAGTASVLSTATITITPWA